jgi:DNA-binding XRE family transcriptional regulator
VVQKETLDLCADASKTYPARIRQKCPDHPLVISIAPYCGRCAQLGARRLGAAQGQGVAHVTEPNAFPSGEPLEVLPIVVLSKTFPARPSSIPEIREFVRRCLADSPLTAEDNGEVSQTVFRALLDAAGPTGEIQISFRIFPEHVEVDVLHSHPGLPEEPTLRQMGDVRLPTPAAEPAEETPRTFAAWMSRALRREGLTQEQAARQLGVSVKTVSRWVGGETEPRLRDLRRIQQRFGDTPLS